MITTPIHSSFADAQRAFQAAKAEFEAFEYGDIESAEGEALVDRLTDSRDAFLATPAPDAMAALAKAYFLLTGDEDDGSLPCWPDRLVEPVVADIRRILAADAQQAATSFDPEYWLMRFLAVGGWAQVDPDGRLFAGWKIDGYTEEQNDEARQVWKEIENNAERRSAVCAILESGAAIATPCAQLAPSTETSA